MVNRPLIALTGSTGFIGKALLKEIQAAGLPVRALVRKRPEGNGGCTNIRWVPGDLGSTAALASLVKGADTVIHLAGATKARTPAQYHQVNAAATGELVAQARAAGVRHFVHVSSLTARRPEVSAYARSKAESEIIAREKAGGMALTIIRAPAVLGPGDDATRPMFAALARGLMVAPGGVATGNRFSIIDVADVANYLLTEALAGGEGVRCLEPAGHLSLGWEDIRQGAEQIAGRPVRLVQLSPSLMKVAGQMADLAVKLGTDPQVFSGGKVSELLSGDWIAGTQVSHPTPLMETLERCLAPFLPVRSGSGVLGKA